MYNRETTIFYQELMTFNQFKNEKKLSEITLALIEDSGWYNYIYFFLFLLLLILKNKNFFYY